MPKTEELRKVYFDELKKRVLNDPDYNWPDKSDNAIMVVVNKMLKSVAQPGNKSDWLGNNGALRAASRKVGIKSSPELRALFQAVS